VWPWDAARLYLYLFEFPLNGHPGSLSLRQGFGGWLAKCGSLRSEGALGL
jgi:hypothetical protein